MCGVNAMANKGNPAWIEDWKVQFCERMAEGRSMRSVCSDKDMPTRTLVENELKSDADFVGQYARACEAREDYLFEDILSLSDDVNEDPAAIAKARLQMDARKWVLGKMRPKKYGDKLDLNHSGDMKVILESDADQL